MQLWLGHRRRGALITCLALGAMFALPVHLQPMADETGWTRAGISGAR